MLGDSITHVPSDLSDSELNITIFDWSIMLCAFGIGVKVGIDVGIGVGVGVGVTSSQPTIKSMRVGSSNSNSMNFSLMTSFPNSPWNF